MRAHQRSRGVIADEVDVFIIPVLTLLVKLSSSYFHSIRLLLTQRGNASIIVASVKDNKVQEVSHLKRPPDPQVIVEVYLASGGLVITLHTSAYYYLPDRHPLKIGSHGIHLALVHTNAAIV